MSACSFEELVDFVNTSGAATTSPPLNNPRTFRRLGRPTSPRTVKRWPPPRSQWRSIPIPMLLPRSRANAAVTARPGDPRYPIYRAWFHRYNGDSTSAIADMDASRGLTNANIPNEAEAQRRWDEYFLDVTLNIMRSHLEGSETYDYLFVGYCGTLRHYRTQYYAPSPGRRTSTSPRLRRCVLRGRVLSPIAGSAAGLD